MKSLISLTDVDYTQRVISVNATGRIIGGDVAELYRVANRPLLVSRDAKALHPLRELIDGIKAHARTADSIARAFEIADESMFELLLGHCVVGDEHKTVLGLVDEAANEVRSLTDADPNIVEAFEWLQPRGYVELAKDAEGEHILVVRRPGED